MALSTKTLQKIYRHYRDQTGDKFPEMHDVAKFARDRFGVEMPLPPSPLDMLAKKFSRAVREEERIDKETGEPYRANHSFDEMRGDEKIFRWLDIDEEAPRDKMHKSIYNRREQMIGDGLQLIRDAEHWNRIHPEEDPIQLSLDFGDEIEWRRNAPGDDEEEAAAAA
ncbi:MAG TPA: hypothetical protein PKD26_06460 [Pyrinomonadaceae bacterium]|nr:hypothetical protein [Pyrinomonadaceae bacterium]